MSASPRPAEEVTIANPPKAADGQPLAVPGYELLRELGRGGMGVVYLARQTALNREVALKMILAGAHAGEEERRRFLAEAEAMAAIQHPGIVQVYDYGTHEGWAYFAQEYCGGGSLADRLQGTPLLPREAARLVEQVARAVQAAHEHGILHRDVKPANVLLQGPTVREGAGRGALIQGALPDGRALDLIQGALPDGRALDLIRGPTVREGALPGALPDGRVCDGVPKVADFGLARRLEGGGGLTQTGALVGTPSYMAPEQARGLKQLTPAADVYSLGAVLYECLTGRPPFRAATQYDTLVQVVADDPVPPRQLNAQVPADLETICLKCLRKEPAGRYASAAELADDLRRWQAGEPITARPTGRVERVWKAVRRRPLVWGLAATAVLALLLGTAASTYFGLEALQQAKRAEQREGEARTALTRFEEALAFGLLRPLGHQDEDAIHQTTLLKIELPDNPLLAFGRPGIGFHDSQFLNPYELTALEELAGLTPEFDHARLLFLSRPLESPGTAEQLQRRVPPAPSPRPRPPRGRGPASLSAAGIYPAAAFFL